ncbi:lipopolysaccharide-induced tumor necrosis factor-alpha factor homolog [Nomia melanderi]|uniref:lipopolysaccharide-induced tumor necrosis factor-alpha factor homolog n=1 Tax=Nomia melanderi TaxID=2448451 RepID=UPI00130462BC|nr:lipopolysaccharide-induced tumor necrosis factor-alpha factor homolog [Nomia melanderi]XP_031846538.1 lipopolysaccharide-induced tumor necrosis factor-alpha factor homolog [Nomia melanderi]
MEKNMGFAVGGTEPSAPPTAPPSYEEAVGNITSNPAPPTNLPYPVGEPSMPRPFYNQPSSQPAPSYPTNYPGPGEPSIQRQMPYNPSPNFVPPTEIRIIHQPIAYQLSPNPIKMTCPTCHSSIKTTTISDHQPTAHICCIVLCLLGCCLCSCLPYCMSSFMSVHHFCPNCKNYIGTWKG